MLAAWNPANIIHSHLCFSCCVEMSAMKSRETFLGFISAFFKNRICVCLCVCVRAMHFVARYAGASALLNCFLQRCEVHAGSRVLECSSSGLVWLSWLHVVRGERKTEVDVFLVTGLSVHYPFVKSVPLQKTALVHDPLL